MDSEPTARTFELLAQIADRLAPELDDVVAAMDAAVIETVPELGADAAIAAESSASNRANVQRFLALARRAESGPAGGVPPEALDLARTVVRRGIALDAIFQGYRRGQQIALERWMVAAAEIAGDGPELVRITRLSMTMVFAYVDESLRGVLAEAERERDAVIGGALTRRTETIRLLLDGAPIDEATASARLGYELSAGHTALVVWADTSATPHDALERAAALIAHAAGARRPLTLAAGATTLWAWISTDREPRADELRAALEQSHASVRVAVGSTRSGITGFRASHEAALAIHRLLARNPGAERFATYRELEVTALAAQDRQRADEFVTATLGALAEDTPTAERLRETLRVHLEEAEHAPRAAARLNMHRNTVLQRVARATELLGHPPGERRLAVELALELRRRLGPPRAAAPRGR